MSLVAEGVKILCVSTFIASDFYILTVPFEVKLMYLC